MPCFGIFGLDLKKKLLSYLKSAPSNLSNCKMSQNVWDQKCLIWVLILKNYFHIWNQHLRVCLIAKICEEIKVPKFEKKHAFFWNFWAKILKNCCQIWNQHLWICLIPIYREIVKMPKFGNKCALFRYFWAKILKPYCHIWYQHLRIGVIAKFWKETGMVKFRTKNALFWYFWSKMPYLCIFGQEFWKGLCHIWNKHPQIRLLAKFHEKT